MSSIRSTLIRSCFANIQRELVQLEDWLSRDYTELPIPSVPAGTDGNIIYQAIQQLSKQLDSQQHTLHHIIDRIDVLEETRNIRIQEKDDSNPWLDTEGVQLQNEIIDHEYEPIVNVNKTDDVVAPMAAPMVAPMVAPSVTPVIAPVVPPSAISEVALTAALEEVSTGAPTAAALAATPEVAPVEAPVAQPEVVPVAQPEVVPVAQPEAAPEEEEEAEEEEDGLEEIEYNGATYYRDSNLVMYQLDEEGQLTDPVGVWKEKSQTIKFYKK